MKELFTSDLILFILKEHFIFGMNGFAIFLVFFLLYIQLGKLEETSGRGNMKRKYRIVKVTYKNGKCLYYIQRQCKYLRKYIFFGDKLWKTYDKVYDGVCSSHASWYFSIKFGTSFDCEEDARKMIKIIKMESGWKIKSFEVI